MLHEVGSPLYRSWCLKARTSHHFSTLEQLAWLLGERTVGLGAAASPEPDARALDPAGPGCMSTGRRKRVGKGPVTSWFPYCKPEKKTYITSTRFWMNSHRTELSLVENKRTTEPIASEGVVVPQPWLPIFLLKCHLRDLQPVLILQQFYFSLNSPNTQNECFFPS